MSEAKEGKLFGRKKLLNPLLGSTEGTKITSTIIFYTSHSLTVYSTEELIYPASSLVAEFGGTLSLFLGFSFISLWDNFSTLKRLFVLFNNHTMH